MKDSSSLHQKVQEHCDCFATTDPLKGMSEVAADPDPGEAAIKWLALAVLHGIDRNAKKISLYRSSDGGVRVVAEYRDSQLPSPGSEVGPRVLEAVREVMHLDEDKGKMPLALGIRDSSIDLKVKLKREEGEERLTLRFPD